MFFTGLLLGALVMLIVVAGVLLWLGAEPESNPERAVVRDLERQTIHDLIATELAEKRASAETPVSTASEGAAVELKFP